MKSLNDKEREMLPEILKMIAELGPLGLACTKGFVAGLLQAKDNKAMEV